MNTKQYGCIKIINDWKNKMSMLKLNAINKASIFYNTFYKKYFAVLKDAKLLINQHRNIQEIIRIQSIVVSEYQKVWWLLQNDPNFSAIEINQMRRNYHTILESSLNNNTLLIHIISSLSVRMTYGLRVNLIKNVGAKVQENFKVLRHYHIHNCLISLQRSDSVGQKDHLEKIYGLTTNKSNFRKVAYLIFSTITIIDYFTGTVK